MSLTVVLFSLQPLKPASTAVETPPNYSFSTPKLVTSESSVQVCTGIHSHVQCMIPSSFPQTPPKQISTSFQFSVPKPCTPSKTQQQLQTTPPHPPALTTRKQATPTTQEAPPPLKSISVVDILKGPDYQSLTAGRIPSSVTTPEQPAESEVVDLTEESEEQGKEKAAETRSTGEESEVTGKFPSSFSSGVQPTTASLSSTSLLQTHLQLPASSTTAITNQPPSTVAVSPSTEAMSSSVSSTQSSAIKPLTGFSAPAGSWECSTCLVQNISSQEKCVACATAKPAVNQSTKLATPPLTSVSKLAPLPQFATSKNSWECSTCLVPNSASQSKCIASATPKPGGVVSGNLATNKTAVQPPVVEFGSQGGLQLGSGGLQFGKAAPVLSGSTGFKLSSGLTLAPAGQTQSDTMKALPTTTPPLQPLAQFAPPEGSWSCDTCMVSNKKTDSQCIACGSAKPGDPTSDRPAVTSATAPIVFGTGGGLKLGAGGLKLGMVGQGMKIGEGSGDGGLKFGSGGIKFGSGGLKFGDGGLQIGSKGGLAVGNPLQKSSQNNKQTPSGPPQLTLSGHQANEGIQGADGTGMQTLGSSSGNGMGLKLTPGPQVSLGTLSQQSSSANPLSGLQFCPPTGPSLPPSTAQSPAVPSFTFSGTSSVPSIGQSPLLPAPTQPPLGAASSSLVSQNTSPASTAIFPTGGLSSTAATNTFSSTGTSAPGKV